MNYRDVALQAAERAGRILRKHYRTGFEVKLKDALGRDFVTEADLESEKAIIDIIKKHYPLHSIMSEESGTKTRSTDYLWIIDPLDGTSNFSRGMPLFSVSIGLVRQGRVIMGLVHDPIARETFYADRNAAFMNGRRISVSSTRTLQQSTMSQSLDYSNEKRRDNLRNINQVIFRAGSLRMLHSTALELCMVACGRLDAFMVTGANPWDIAAGAYIIEKAGGKVTSFDGSAWDFMRPRIVCTNKIIHDDLLNVLGRST